MTLHAIVRALGGDLYQGGFRANVPAPGHSDADRSVSLWLNRGRVVIHGFGGADWRCVRDLLRDRGFINAAGQLTGAGRTGPPAPQPDRRLRLETAMRLWEEAVPLGLEDAASLYLRRRAINARPAAPDLRLHPSAPVRVYGSGGPARPALVARISDAADRLTAVELTYLEHNGLPALGLALPRKTVGVVPPGATVRLAAAAPDMLAGEGVATTLSAMERFGRPGWALMSANNLAAWTPPSCVRDLLIAADRGAVGEAAAARLRHRLLAKGLTVRTLCPDAPFGDWNEVARNIRKEESEGAGRRRSGGDRPRRPAGEPS